MFGLSSFFAALTVVALAVGGVLALFFGSLPVELDQWDRRAQAKSWLVTISLAIVFGVVLFFALASAPGSAFLGTPSGIVALYLIAAARAALLSGRRSAV
jgi:hypothetical protein